PLTRLPEFLLGVVLARIVRAGRWPHVRARWVMLFTVVIWVAVFVLPAAYARSGIFAIPVSLFIPILASRDLQGATGFFHRRWVVALGEASYATYLIHYLLFAVTRYLVGADRKFGVLAGAVIVCGMLVVAHLGGLLLYKLVEHPMMRRFASPSRPRGNSR